MATDGIRLSIPGSSSRANEPSVPSIRPILADLKREGFGQVIVQDDDRIALEVKFPGLQTMALDLEDLENFAEFLMAEDPSKDSPAGIYRRTSTIDSEGNVSGLFSYQLRARSLTVPQNERAGVADLIATMIDHARKAVAAHLEAEEKKKEEERIAKEKEAQDRAAAAAAAKSTPSGSTRRR